MTWLLIINSMDTSDLPISNWLSLTVLPSRAVSTNPSSPVTALVPDSTSMEPVCGCGTKTAEAIGYYFYWTGWWGNQDICFIFPTLLKQECILGSHGCGNGRSRYLVERRWAYSIYAVQLWVHGTELRYIMNLSSVIFVATFCQVTMLPSHLFTYLLDRTLAANSRFRFYCTVCVCLSHHHCYLYASVYYPLEPSCIYHGRWNKRQVL